MRKCPLEQNIDEQDENSKSNFVKSTNQSG